VGVVTQPSAHKGRPTLDYALSNELEIKEGALTGRVVGGIVDGQAKRDAVAQACLDIGCSHEQVIAVGDGANDLPMMQVAGLGGLPRQAESA
jgi:phosphoserine phosphatase